MLFFYALGVVIYPFNHHVLLIKGKREKPMIKFKHENTPTLSNEEERELDLAQQRDEMHKMQLTLDAYTKQQIYDYQTARDMLTEIQKRYRMYEAEEFFGTTPDRAILH
jgi:hypothetical protein